MADLRKNFSKALKLHCVAGSRGNFAPGEYIYFKDGYAYAVSNHLYVRVKLDKWSGFEDAEIALLHGKSIHRELYKQLLEYDIVNVTVDGFVCVHDSAIITFPFIDFYEMELVDRIAALMSDEDVVHGATPIGDNKDIELDITILTSLMRSTGEGKWRLNTKRSNNLMYLIPEVGAMAEVEAIVAPILFR